MLTTDDVCGAADVLAGPYHRTNDMDGRVSIEMDLRLTYETRATIDQAAEMHTIVDRPNLLIKIPGHPWVLACPPSPR